MSDALSDIKDIMIIAVIGAVGFAVYYIVTKVVPNINKNINQSIGGMANSAIQQQEQQTNPTIQTSIANPGSGSSGNLYLDIPTNVIQGSNETIYAFSTNQNDNIVLGIANSNGWGVWQGTGTGSVKTPSLDTLHLTVGSKYIVTAIDMSNNLSRQGSFVYQSSESNSLSNILNQIEKGAQNVFNYFKSL